MIIIRPTASLAKRMKVKLEHNDAEGTGRLGDWYALDMALDRRQFILCVSSISRLAVVLNAAPYVSMPERLTDAVPEVLKAIGVDEAKTQEERQQMNQFVLAKTVNKSILGSLNEYRFQLEAFNQMGRLDLNSTFEMSMYLSGIISLIIPEHFPKDAALKVFGQSPSATPPLRAITPIKSGLYLVK